MNKPLKCHICNCDIDSDRQEGLNVLGILPQFATCIKCAPDNRNVGIYLGESGASPLVIANKPLGDYLKKDYNTETVFDK